MKKIACLDVFAFGARSQYNVLSEFIGGLHQALIEEGIDSRLISYDKYFPGGAIEELISDRPDCILSFNSIPVNDQDECIYYDLNIPQITVMVDAPYYFLPVLNYSKVVFLCYDRGMSDYYNSKGFHGVHFFPHAAVDQSPPDWEKPRKYDVIMPSSPIDPDRMRSLWEKSYSPDFVKLMEEAAEIALVDPELNVHAAIIKRMNSCGKELVASKTEWKRIVIMLELYFRAIDRIRLIKSIKDVRVDIFGKEEGLSWKELIRQDNVVVHGPLKFDEMVRTMHESRVVLNSTPMIKDGAHERVLSALMSGASVLSSKNKYLAEQFPEGSGIGFYQPGEYSSINEQLKQILADEDKRIREAKVGRGIVAASHTWASRAKMVRDVIGPLVDAMTTERVY